MDVLAEGSFPGEDIRSSLRLIAGEADSSLFLPWLPQRDPMSSALGRMSAILPDMHWAEGHRGFVARIRPSRLSRRSDSLLGEDLDALDEIVEVAGVTGAQSPWPLMIPLLGRLTIARDVELANGHRVLTDPGALRDVCEQLAGGANDLAREVHRRTGRHIILLFDDRTAADVVEGTVQGVCDFDSIDPVPLPAADCMWAQLVEAQLVRNVSPRPPQPHAESSGPAPVSAAESAGVVMVPSLAWGPRSTPELTTAVMATSDSTRAAGAPVHAIGVSPYQRMPESDSTTVHPLAGMGSASLDELGEWCDRHRGHCALSIVGDGSSQSFRERAHALSVAAQTLGCDISEESSVNSSPRYWQSRVPLAQRSLAEARQHLRELAELVDAMRNERDETR